MELVVDMRETSLMEKLDEEKILYKRENLTVGDLLLKFQDQVLLMIERKTVRDLVASLRDGRYHNQRQRWKDFMTTYPDSKVAVWIEGDLLGCYDVENGMKSSLVNSLLRLQSKHGILVYQIRNSAQFVQSLEMVKQKFEKDPSHLQTNQGQDEKPIQVLDLKPFKKTTEVTSELVWRSTLSLIPGVSSNTADKIVQVFPTLKSLVNDEHAQSKLETILVGGKRLGRKTAEKIIKLLCV